MLNQIQKRIEQKAQERFEKDFSVLVKLIAENPIGNMLKIKISNDESEKFIKIVNMHGNSGSVVFNERYHYQSKYFEKTNIEEIKDKLIEKYIKEESDNLLSTLQNIESFINQH